MLVALPAGRGAGVLNGRSATPGKAEVASKALFRFVGVATAPAQAYITA